MSPECPCSREASGRKGRTRRAGSIAGLLASALAILAPKCPMCLAAYLSLFGLGAIASWLAPVLLPLGLAVGLVAVASLVVTRRRARAAAR